MTVVLLLSQAQTTRERKTKRQ